MKSYKKLILSIIFFCFCESLLADNAVLKIVGTSADQVVTNRDIEIDRIVESILFDKPLPEITSHIDQVLLEHAIDKEAQVFALSRVSNREVRSELTRFRDRLSSEKKMSALWKDLRVTRSELMSSIRRKLRANKFIKFKEQSSLIPITDEEALNYYQENKNDYGKANFSTVSDQIKTALSRKRAKDRMDQWRLDLKSKHSISKN